MPWDGGFPYFLWQQEHNRGWETLTFDETSALNKAAADDKKTLALPMRNATVYFKNMISKSKISGDEKRVRCLILNSESVYAVWSYKERDEGSFACYIPRMTYFLEVMFLKKLSKVNFYYKTEYEVDFLEHTIKDLQTGVLYDVQREEIAFVRPNWHQKNMDKHIHNIYASEDLLKAVITYSVERVKNLLFNTLVSDADVSDSFSLSVVFKDLKSFLENQEETPTERLMTVDPNFSFIDDNSECHVVSENGCPFFATLILTNLEENVNKYYILQLLEIKNRKIFIIWRRHGRVGCDRPGCGETGAAFSNLKAAQKDFEKQFYEKTKNHWSERHSFQRKPQYYDYIHTYFNHEILEDIFNNKSLENIKKSKLDENVKELLKLIYSGEDLGHVAKTWLLTSMATNVGLPTLKQLLEAFTALNEVANLLSLKKKGRELLEACNNYYMKLPHNTKYEAPKVIVSAEAMDKEIYMLQTLAYISVKEACKFLENPIDLFFKSFQWKITHLRQTSPKYKVLQKSLSELQGPTHSFQVTLLDAFEWNKQIEEERFLDKGNNMLLWHGTHVSNFIGIIKHGLKVPPNDTPCTNYMFGRALYFADASSKSANYCLTTQMNTVGLLLLCEVSMGNTDTVIYSGDYSSLPNTYHGLIALGHWIPSGFTKTVLAPDAVMPMGPLKRSNNDQVKLNYNEYIIYNDRQVKIRYLLKINIM